MEFWTIIDPEGRPIKDPSGRFAAMFDSLELAQQALERAQRVRHAECRMAKLSARAKWVPVKQP